MSVYKCTILSCYVFDFAKGSGHMCLTGNSSSWYFDSHFADLTVGSKGLTKPPLTHSDTDTCDINTDHTPHPTSRQIPALFAN